MASRAARTNRPPSVVVTTYSNRKTQIAGKQTLADPGKGIVHRTRNALGDIGNRLTKGPGGVRRTATTATTRKALHSTTENIGTEKLLKKEEVGGGAEKQIKKADVGGVVKKQVKRDEIGGVGKQQVTKEESGSGDADIESLTNAFSLQRFEIEDIDEKDVGEFMLKEYVQDIDDYLFSIEKNYAVREDFMKDRSINSRMRAVLLDWLVEVHSQFGLCQETLFMAQKNLDRYLQLDTSVCRSQLQLAGVTALLIAVKFEEVSVPTIVDFSSVSDNAFKPSDVRLMEVKMLKVLKYDLGSPSPVHFLRRWSKAYSADFHEYNLAKYVMELALVDYTVCHLYPSAVAASSLALSLLVLNKKPIRAAWSPTMVHYTRYSLQQLKPSLKLLIGCLSRIYEDGTASNKFQSVMNKYARSRFLRTSKLPQLQTAHWKARVVTEVNGL